MVDRNGRWVINETAELGRVISNGKRGLCCKISSLNFIQRDTWSNLYFAEFHWCKEWEWHSRDWAVTGRPDPSSAFRHEKYGKIPGRGISYASTCPKILLLHFKILGMCLKCKFHSKYISICMQIFKMYAYAKPICLRIIGKPSWKY